MSCNHFPFPCVGSIIHLIIFFKNIITQIHTHIYRDVTKLAIDRVIWWNEWNFVKCFIERDNCWEKLVTCCWHCHFLDYCPQNCFGPVVVIAVGQDLGNCWKNNRDHRDNWRRHGSRSSAASGSWLLDHSRPPLGPMVVWWWCDWCHLWTPAVRWSLCHSFYSVHFKFFPSSWLWVIFMNN